MSNFALTPEDLIEEAQLRQERLKFFVRLTERCIDVLSELKTHDMYSRYARNDSSGFLDCYVFTYLSDRTMFLDVVAKFSPSELKHAGSHQFASHAAFEKVIQKYTRTAKKPNLCLEKSRPWDVAVNLVMKVEALEPLYSAYYSRLLKREFTILEHIWDSYLQDQLDFDDMIGIPMVFDYSEVPNQRYCLPAGETIEEIDLYGRLVQTKLDLSLPTLSYMTVEKLGPSLNYVTDLMSSAKKQPVGLSISTALKVFDQLVCRLLMIHRFGVIHNGVCPQNIYFGRGICCSVVYLNNFRAATLASGQALLLPVVNMHLAKDLRFASLNLMKSTDVHPVDDIESAFYTLLASIGVSLPWDHLIQASKTPDSAFVVDDSSIVSDQNIFSQSSLKISDQNIFSQSSLKISDQNIFPRPNLKISAGSKSTPARELLAAIWTAKTNFWDSTAILERCIANLLRRLCDREFDLFNVIAGILNDLYIKVKRLITTYSSSKNSIEFCAQLCRGGNAVQLYTDLRKPGMMLFTFEKAPSFLNNLTFINRQTSLTKGVEHRLVGWNLSEWCFNCVEVRPPGSRVSRVSMMMSDGQAKYAS